MFSRLHKNKDRLYDFSDGPAYCLVKCQYIMEQEDYTINQAGEAYGLFPMNVCLRGWMFSGKRLTQAITVEDK